MVELREEVGKGPGFVLSIFFAVGFRKVTTG